MVNEMAAFSDRELMEQTIELARQCQSEEMPSQIIEGESREIPEGDES